MQDAALVVRVVPGSRHSFGNSPFRPAHAYPGKSTLDPRNYDTNNVAHSIAFVNALLDAGARNLIFSSSRSIYGATKSIPVTKDRAWSATDCARSPNRKAKSATPRIPKHT